MFRQIPDPPGLKLWEADDHISKTHHGVKIDVLAGASGPAELVFGTHALITATCGRAVYTMPKVGTVEVSENADCTMFLPKQTPAVFQYADIKSITIIRLSEDLFMRAMRGASDYSTMIFKAFRDREDRVLRNAADLLRSIALDQRPTHPALIVPLLESIAARILLHVDGPLQRAPDLRRSISPQQLAALTAYIDANLSRTIRLPELAELMNMSIFHFSREFKAVANTSPMKYVLERRVEAAKRALIGPAPLAEVALDVGFSSQSHFTTAFKTVTGVTPSAWRSAS